MLKKLFNKPPRQTARSAPDNMDDLLNPSISNPSVTNPTVAAFLHGRLSVRVIEARNVEGPSSRFMDRLERAVTSSVDGVDPYCSVKLSYNKVLQTPVVQNSPNPVWNTHAVFDVCHDFNAIEFRIKAAKRTGPLAIISKVKHLSQLSITTAEIAEKRTISGWFPLGTYQREIIAETGEDENYSSEEDPDAEPPSAGSFGDLCIEIIYEPVRELDIYDDLGVPNTYFPVRTGVNYSMYQNADAPPESLPIIPFHPDYEHGRCWIDIAKAIMSATQFIYITGWAVWPELVMVRTHFPGDQWQDITLGEMLKQKAEEGVNVCVMVWDELASGTFHKGIMGTHDEEVISYFRKSKVNAVKVSRQNPKDGPLADLNCSILFTHHQKIVITTQMDPNTGRDRLQAWVGGLDLTDGRYDNPQHSLFRTIGDLHAPPDFWQACALGVSAESGPREPWHDIHGHVTGTAAWDVLTNFEGRWMRQAPSKMKERLHEHGPDTVMQPAEEHEIRDGSWDVQVLRSINEASTFLNSDRGGLIVRRNALIDLSIHHAYVHQIRRAKHFIYIENQYFLSSSHMWLSGQRGGFAPNLVAIEIAEKICAKIRANERFAVYVNVPLYPEGAPASGPVQEILSHQRKTVSVITQRIAETIAETGIDSSISDWFNVFCLVNRESVDGSAGNGGSTPLEQQLSASRRFMVYIHSKFAVFDDTAVIIGSANVNSRSLDGSRDTEIACLAWQPEYVSTGSNGYGIGEGEEGEMPKGDVAAFRASVFSQHLGEYLEVFENPSSLECVHLIRDMAAKNWDHFADDSVEDVLDMPHGHLALYPYEIDESTGEISTKQECFPDFPTALIKGKATPGIPNILTG